jgi:uncharacterized protein (TIGR04255 family)
VQVLPGYLYSKLSGEKHLESLPAGQIPYPVRSQDAGLAVQPILRLLWDRYILGFGDAVFSIACQLPYPGWSVFREQIFGLSEMLLDSGVIDRVLRFDLRYVDLIDGQHPEDLAPKLDATLCLGGIQLTGCPFNLQTVVERGGMFHRVALTLPAELSVGQAKTHRRGLLLVVNTTTDWSGDTLKAFVPFLHARLDNVHAANKETFFACLTDDAVQAMGPETC